jgi:hypothetical protein
MMMAGLDIYENELLTVTREDWSQVRSKARAIRRRKRGFPQRVRTLVVPDPKAYRMGNKVYMHPQTFRMLRELCRDRISGQIDRDFFRMASGF